MPSFWSGQKRLGFNKVFIVTPTFFLLFPDDIAAPKKGEENRFQRTTSIVAVWSGSLNKTLDCLPAQVKTYLKTLWTEASVYNSVFWSCSSDFFRRKWKLTRRAGKNSREVWLVTVGPRRSKCVQRKVFQKSRGVCKRYGANGCRQFVSRGAFADIISR